MAIQLDHIFVNQILPHLKEHKEYAMIDQMSRSVGSIADNIAEGFERNGNKEFIHFLSIAKGSSGEFRSQLIRCKHRLKTVDLESHISQALKLNVKIGNLQTYLINCDMKGVKFNTNDAFKK